MDGVLRVAFVGCGNIAKYHHAALLRSGRVVVTALVDPDPDSRAAIAKLIREAAGDAAVTAPREFGSLKEALAADPQKVLFTAVDIMVPSYIIDGQDLHETVASEALRGQRHVLLEKPVTAHPDAALRLAALSRAVAPTCVLAVAENSQFWPEVLAAKASIDNGDIGELLTVRAKAWESAVGEWAGDYAEGGWRCDASKLPSASFTYDSASHWIRPLRIWMGEVSRVVGVTGKSVKHMAGVSFSQHIISFESGKSAIFETMLAPQAISDQPFFVLQGSEGEIVIDHGQGRCTLHTLAKDTNAPVTTVLCRSGDIDTGWDASYVGEYADFTAAVLDGASTMGSVTEAISDLCVVRALFDSAETGKWVDL